MKEKQPPKRQPAAPCNQQEAKVLWSFCEAVFLIKTIFYRKSDTITSDLPVHESLLS